LILSILISGLGLANGAALQAMNQFSPERPALFFDFVLPPGPKDLFSNLWIADPHDAAPALSMALGKNHPRNFEPGLSKLQSGDPLLSYEEPAAEPGNRKRAQFGKSGPAIFLGKTNARSRAGSRKTRFACAPAPPFASACSPSSGTTSSLHPEFSHVTVALRTIFTDVPKLLVTAHGLR